MRLTDREIKLFLGYLKTRRMYAPHPYASFIWEEWMESTINKLENELYYV
jgi:hypothetical protein